MKTKKTRNQAGWLIGIAVFTILFMIVAVIFKVFEVDILPSQFIGALLGVVITAIITVLLLKGQTSSEEEKEKSLKVFEKRQEVYHSFLDKLNEIIQDGKLELMNFNSEQKENTTDELINLIFQLSQLKMHTSSENIESIFKSIKSIINELNEFIQFDVEDKRKNLINYYKKISSSVFQIATILKNDLYPGDTKNDKSEFEHLLDSLKIQIGDNELSKEQIISTFLKELKEKLEKKLSINIAESASNETSINHYYRLPKAGRWNLDIRILLKEIYKFKEMEVPVDFVIQIDSEMLVYGLFVEGDNLQKKLEEICPKLGYSICKEDIEGVYPVYKWPKEENRINFFRKSENYDNLRYNISRNNLINNIVLEVRFLIEQFCEYADSNDLSNFKL